MRRALLLNGFNHTTIGILNFASSRSEWPMTGFISIAVASLNSIAQLAVVFNCKPPKRNSSFIGPGTLLYFSSLFST